MSRDIHNLDRNNFTLGDGHWVESTSCHRGQCIAICSFDLELINRHPDSLSLALQVALFLLVIASVTTLWWKGHVASSNNKGVSFRTLGFQVAMTLHAKCICPFLATDFNRNARICIGISRFDLVLLQNALFMNECCCW